MDSSLEFTTGLAALLAMAATVVAKIACARLLAVSRHRIKGVTETRLELLNQHHGQQAQRKIAEANLKTLEKKKLKLEGKRSRLRKTIDELAAEYGARYRQREVQRDALVRD